MDFDQIEQDLGKMSVIERKHWLGNNSDATLHDEQYTRELTDSEWEGLKEDLSVTITDKVRHDDKKEEFMTPWKVKDKDLKNRLMVQGREIESKVRRVTENLYEIINFDTGKVAQFNDVGELVNTRRATRSELQMSIGSGNLKSPLTGTN